MKTNRLCQTLQVVDQDLLLSQCSTIEQALTAGSELELYPGPLVGQRCRVLDGPFQGVEGTVLQVQGRQKIILEISALGLGASLEITADLLEPLGKDDAV